MSRSWKRNVRKNAKAVSAYRQRQGMAPVSDWEQAQVYKGRSIMLSLFFVVVPIFLMLTTPVEARSNMYWVTTICYFLMALFVYTVRRPYLKIGKSTLSKRGFAKEYQLSSEAIKQINVKAGSVIIEPKGRQKWIYSKTFNRFATDEIAAVLRSFAEQNNISFVDETAKDKQVKGA